MHAAPSCRAAWSGSDQRLVHALDGPAAHPHAGAAALGMHHGRPGSVHKLPSPAGPDARERGVHAGAGASSRHSSVGGVHASARAASRDTGGGAVDARARAAANPDSRVRGVDAHARAASPDAGEGGVDARLGAAGEDPCRRAAHVGARASNADLRPASQDRDVIAAWMT
jgi:hypothetical protein